MWLSLEFCANRLLCLAGVSWDSCSQKRSLTKLRTISNERELLNSMFIKCPYSSGTGRTGTRGCRSFCVSGDFVAYQQLGEGWNSYPCQLKPRMFRPGYNGSTTVPLKSPGVFKRLIQGSWSLQSSSWRPGRIIWSPEMALLYTSVQTIGRRKRCWRLIVCVACCISDVLSSFFVFDTWNSEIHS